jgi:hypothetical protein
MPEEVLSLSETEAARGRDWPCSDLIAKVFDLLCRSAPVEPDVVPVQARSLER